MSATPARRCGISLQKVSSHKRPDKSTADCFIIEPSMARDILQAVRDACLWLPEAEEFMSHGAPNFRVRGKTFATYALNHHGDGRVALWLNAPAGVAGTTRPGRPRHFFVPPYVGPRGWLGVILDRGIELAPNRRIGARGLRKSGARTDCERASARRPRSSARPGRCPRAKSILSNRPARGPSCRNCARSA